MKSFFVALFLLVSAASAYEFPFPTPTAQRKAPPGLEGLFWNKWDTDHFSVLSIDKSYGNKVQSFIESERADILRRWSIRGSDDFYCKLVCVKDKEMLKKMFSIDDPRCEVISRSDGTPEVAAIWIDADRIGMLPSLLLEAELSFDEYPLYIKRGVPFFERPSPKSSLEFASSTPCSSITDAKKSESLFKTNARSFDADSAILCLMARKEFGRLRFAEVARPGESDLPGILGFESQKDLDDTFARYRNNILQDVKDGKTPEDYLGVLGK
jgi:hypothetical protein